MLNKIKNKFSSSTVNLLIALMVVVIFGIFTYFTYRHQNSEAIIIATAPQNVLEAKFNPNDKIISCEQVKSGGLNGNGITNILGSPVLKGNYYNAKQTQLVWLPGSCQNPSSGYNTLQISCYYDASRGAVNVPIGVTPYKDSGYGKKCDIDNTLLSNIKNQYKNATEVNYGNIYNAAWLNEFGYSKKAMYISFSAAGCQIQDLSSKIIANALKRVKDSTSKYLPENPTLACSQFVSTVLKDVGAIPGTEPVAANLEKIVQSARAVKVFSDYVEPTAANLAKLLPGDIVFYSGNVYSGTPIHHVGIYSGNGLNVNTKSSQPLEVVNIPITAIIPSVYKKINAYRFNKFDMYGTCDKPMPNPIYSTDGKPIATPTPTPIPTPTPTPVPTPYPTPTPIRTPTPSPRTPTPTPRKYIGF